MEIAVLIGPNGETAPIQAPGELQVYRHNCSTWEVCRSTPFTIHKARGLNALREYMRYIIYFLGDCRTFVGYSITGLPYYELEKVGCITWEMSGYPVDFLDAIVEAESKCAITSTAPAQAPISRPELKEISPGCYSISLKDIQNSSSALSTKQVILPLLAKLYYDSLEIICSHVPPWLELKILSGEIDATIKRTGPQEARIFILR